MSDATVPAAALPLRLLALVKFEHTIFALPFAYAGMLLGFVARGHAALADVVWITVAMVGARTAAMALNRLIDAGIDARNPRTAQRELPAGSVTRSQGWALVALSIAALLVAVSQLAPITWLLWPVPLVLFVLYPYTKRFTWTCHVVLGLTVGLAPLAAWVAVTGSFALAPVLLWLAIAAWVAGFDIIYATHDVAFDRAQGLHSIPVRFGIARGLWVTRVLHGVTVVALATVGVLVGAGIAYWIGVGVVALLLAYENALVRADDLSRADAAFFTVNGIIGVVFAVATAVDAIPAIG